MLFAASVCCAGSYEYAQSSRPISSVMANQSAVERDLAQPIDDICDWPVSTSSSYNNRLHVCSYWQSKELLTRIQKHRAAKLFEVQATQAAMAPKAEKKPAKKVAKKVAGGKGKKGKSKVESFKIYIYKVLKQVRAGPALSLSFMP